MATFLLKTPQGAEAPVVLPPGRHTAGGSPLDVLQIDGAPGRLLDLDVAAAATIAIARAAGCRLGTRQLKIGERRLVRPGDRLEIHGVVLRAQPEAQRASSAAQGTAALARGILGGAAGAASAPLPALVWLNGRDCGKRLPLLDEATFLGRGEGSAARVRDALASRTHAKLTLHGSSARLVHLSSSNGLLVDGRLVRSEVNLFGGEILQIGETELLFDASLPRPPQPALRAAWRSLTIAALAPAQASARPRGGSLFTLELAVIGCASAAGAGLTAAVWFLAR